MTFASFLLPFFVGFFETNLFHFLAFQLPGLVAKTNLVVRLLVVRGLLLVERA